MSIHEKVQYFLMGAGVFFLCRELALLIKRLFVKNKKRIEKQ